MRFYNKHVTDTLTITFSYFLQRYIILPPILLMLLPIILE